IDFIGNTRDCKLKDVEGFWREVGGGGCNVGCSRRKLGGEGEMIRELGEDGLGDVMVERLEDLGVGREYLKG
ncbi:PfkB family carbohydrate kinase, partial [Staphylococcus saprophyticus]|uniref:PfkB family carbohydrate kinase n=1 Tax=Staphylococcus saprophyticus TaxID=29385 RepID=UPI0021B1B647